MTLKTYKKAIRASAILAAIVMSGGAFATEGISESFELATEGAAAETVNAKLSGNGTVAAATLPAATGMGYPISTNHNQALEIAGTVTYAEGSAPAVVGASQVDFMFKVEPTDELEDPTGNDIKVALAVGTNAANTTTAPIKLWCKTTSDGAADWVDLAPAVTTGSWMRATLVLDYDAGKCSVSLDGSPALNGTDKWFFFANDDESRYVSSITMVGSTMVDDLVVTHTALASYKPAGSDATITPAGTSVAVDYGYINKYGVTAAQVASDAVVNETSGMKISEKFVAGLDPKSDTKFELKTMTTAINSATVTFPGNNTSYTLKVGTTKGGGDIGTADSSPTAAKTDSGETINSATVTIDPEDQGKLLYFTVETK